MFPFLLPLEIASATTSAMLEMWSNGARMMSDGIAATTGAGRPTSTATLPFAWSNPVATATTWPFTPMLGAANPLPFMPQMSVGYVPPMMMGWLSLIETWGRAMTPPTAAQAPQFAFPFDSSYRSDSGHAVARIEFPDQTRVTVTLPLSMAAFGAAGWPWLMPRLQ